MKLKKVLTGSALSLALLVSAAPAFAMTPSNSVQEKSNDSITIQATMTVVQSSNDFANVIYQNGVKWTFSYSYYSGGSWYGVYTS
ncbi:LCI family antimicrobial peptide [Bacillus atrophaeus]|uniref:LCI family antimicrobial peptide n=1 Tax=Bacillus atrophaeus TaxID=1452 RepID=UPI0022813C6D|nr:LCI family antimicrobial peptide [Bacillus atrophaeus]MCY9166037.1 antimicrobial peptide, Lci [Bacillus atrophaeus]